MAKLWDDSGSRAIGRSAANTGNNDNFFTKRAKSIENAVGTTLAVPASFVHTAETNAHTEKVNRQQADERDAMFQKYGFASRDDYYKQLENSWDADGNATAETERLLNIPGLNEEEQALNARHMNDLNNRAAELRDYAENNYVAKKVGQDRGKFAGSAINTLSTAADLTGLTNGPLTNAIQGGIEGVADELEQSGFENFDARRAGQNALVGAASGAAVGAFNKGLDARLAANNGKLFAGNNFATRALNKAVDFTPREKTLPGQIIGNIGRGAVRGGASGAVGGATGGAVSAALNNQDILGSALQGAQQGAEQGAMAGGIMGGTNTVLSRTPGVGDTMRQLNQATENWRNSGNDFNERLTNTLTSGDSAVGEWLQGNRQIGVLNRMRSIGGTLEDTSNVGQSSLSRARSIAQSDAEWQRLLSDISERTKQYSGQRNSDGTRPWSKDLYDYSKIDPELLDTLGISDNLDGSSAAAVTSVLRERGLISDSPIASDRYNYVTQNHSDLPPDIQTRMEIALANGASPNEIDIAATAYSSARADANRGAYANYKSTLKDYNRIMKKYGADANFVDNGSWTPIQRKAMQAYGTPSEASDTPTTLGGWLKKAGMRAVEDINNRGIGLSIKDTGETPKATVQPENPATELYRTVTGEAEQPTATNTNLMYGESELGNRTRRGMLADSLERFGNTLEGAQTNVTRAAAKDLGIESTGKVVENVRKKTGITNVETQGKFAKELTGGADSLMDNVQRMALTASENGQPYKVDTNDIVNNVERIVDKYADTNMFGSQSKKNQFISNLRRDISDFDSDILSISNRMKANAADLRGKGVASPAPLDSAKAKIYSEVAGQLDDLAYKAIPQENVDAMFETTISEMRGRAQQAQANGNNDIAKAYTKAADMLEAEPRTIKAFRSFKKDFVDASKVAELSLRADNGAALQMGRGFGGGLKRLGDTLLQRPVNALLAKTGGAVNDIADRIGRDAGATPTNTPVEPTPAPTTETPANAVTPSTQLYNAIGRTEGEIQGDKAAEGYLQEAARTTAPVAIDNTGNTSSTALYNTVNGAGRTNGLATTSGNTASMTSGDYYTGILERALNMALEANDAPAFGALLGMYQDAVAEQQKNASSASQVKLTDKQRQANAAERALNDFEGTESNFAYDVSDIPIIGGIANLGGNEYASKAEALALQIGYMLSGATVNAQEAKNIGMAYVPQPRDSEAVRKSKLAQIRGIISDYQQTYES